MAFLLPQSKPVHSTPATIAVSERPHHAPGFGGLCHYSAGSPGIYLSTTRLAYSLICLLDGLLTLLEGKEHRCTTDVHAANLEVALYRRIGMGPAPLRGRMLFCTPRFEHALDFACQLRHAVACGVFVGTLVEDDEDYLAVLGVAVVWSVLLEVPAAPQGVLMAHFFDFSPAAHARRRRSDILTSTEKSGELLLLLPLTCPADTGRNKVPAVPFWPARLKDPRPPHEALPFSPGEPTRRPTPVPTKTSGISKKASNYNIPAIRKALALCPYVPDPKLATDVIDMLVSGAGKLQYPGVPSESENLPSVVGNEDAVRGQLLQLAGDGAVSGPHASNPIPGGHIIAMGTVDKGSKWIKSATTKKKRIIFHASHPPKLAINLWSLGLQLFLLYVSQGDLLVAIADYGINTVWLCFDVKRAYHTLNNRESDLWGFIVKTFTDLYGVEYWVYLVNVFGWKDSEASWQAFATILIWIIQNDPDMPSTIRVLAYVDNFFIAVFSLAGAIDTAAVARASAALARLLDRLGVDAHEECSGVSFPGLGWLWHSGTSLSVATSPEKLAAAKFLVNSWFNRQSKKITVAELRSAVGLFTWLVTVILAAKPYLWALRKMLTGGESLCKRLKLPPKVVKLRLNSLVKTGLGLFCKILADSALAHGIPIHPGRVLSAPVDALIRQDASTKTGCGAINFLLREYFAHPWTLADRAASMRTIRESSGHCEATGSMFSTIRWFHRMQGLYVLLEVDSSNVAHAWRRGFSPVASLNEAMAEMRRLATLYNIHLEVRHIHREFNHAADRLSELKFTEFHQELIKLVGVDEASRFVRIG
jgi:hypothetical protein